MKTSSIIKISVLTVLIFIESFLLSQLILDFIRRGGIFHFSIEFSIRTVAYMLLSIYTFSLTAGGWDKWKQYVMIPLPVSLAIFITTVIVFPQYAFFVAAGSALLISLDVNKSTQMKKLMVKFDPKMILRFSTKGILFVFSIFGGVLILLNSTQVEPLNVGQEIYKLIQKPVENIISDQIFPVVNLAILESADLASTPLFEKTEESVGVIVENQINKLIEPYKNFIHPIIAVLTFALFQFYASLAYVIYILTIDLIFLISKKTGFFKIEMATVEQEQLKF